MSNIIKNVMSVFFLLFLLGCSDRTNSEVLSEEDKVPFKLKEQWTCGLQTLVKAELNKKDPKTVSSEVVAVFLELTATDASYLFSGEDRFITKENFRLVKVLLKRNLISKSDLADPFSCAKEFSLNPDKPVKRISVNGDVLEDENSYSKFVKWYISELGL